MKKQGVYQPTMMARPPGRAWRSLGLLLVALASVMGSLSGCAPLVMGGMMVGTALSVTDRRTSGAQLEDQAIELKSLSRISDAVGDRGHASVTSFNRTVLITGEAASEADRSAIERALTGIENVRAVVNELSVMGSSSLPSRTSDTLVTSKVKATLLDAKDVQGNTIKVVTERGTVYLMGIVTEREAARAVALTRSVSGVGKVVRIFEVISEVELANLAPPKKTP